MTDIEEYIKQRRNESATQYGMAQQRNFNGVELIKQNPGRLEPDSTQNIQSIQLIEPTRQEPKSTTQMTELAIEEYAAMEIENEQNNYSSQELRLEIEQKNELIEDLLAKNNYLEEQNEQLLGELEQNANAILELNFKLNNINQKTNVEIQEVMSNSVIEKLELELKIEENQIDQFEKEKKTLEDQYMEEINEFRHCDKGTELQVFELENERLRRELNKSSIQHEMGNKAKDLDNASIQRILRQNNIEITSGIRELLQNLNVCFCIKDQKLLVLFEALESGQYFSFTGEQAALLPEEQLRNAIIFMRVDPFVEFIDLSGLEMSELYLEVSASLVDLQFNQFGIVDVMGSRIKTLKIEKENIAKVIQNGEIKIEE